MFMAFKTGKSFLAMLAVLLYAGVAFCENGPFNVHLELGPTHAVHGWQLRELGPGSGGTLGMDFTLKPIIGLQVTTGFLKFFDKTEPAGYRRIDAPYLIRGALGVRLRPLNDDNGYLWAWRPSHDHTGNLAGNLFVDLNVDYYFTGGLHRFGADLGVGYELSVVNGLQIGPFARVLYVFQKEQENRRNSQDGWFVLAGLSFSLAIPPQGKRLEDTDGDGLYAPYDKCPDIPEDFDRFKDEDGCLDDDNDEDGIFDKIDSCPLKKEDFDGFEDEDGCPEKDNDLDGLEDNEDQCPNEKEDFDRFMDEDGCNDKDNDDDKILDTIDKCPNEAETYNKFRDFDGCPEQDSDGDGVFDVQDLCPNELETINGIEDEDGCPDKGLVEVQADRILLGERIFFDLNMVRIKTRGKVVLAQLANLINQHPEFELISIEGHADASGNLEVNQQLSEARAERVKTFLIENGVETDRLTVVGFGESNPWQKNTLRGRWQNRRVEVVIEKLDEEMGAAKATLEAVKEKQNRAAKDTVDEGNHD